jgi:hypothetical protein
MSKQIVTFCKVSLCNLFFPQISTPIYRSFRVPNSQELLFENTSQNVLQEVGLQVVYSQVHKRSRLQFWISVGNEKCDKGLFQFITNFQFCNDCFQGPSQQRQQIVDKVDNIAKEAPNFSDSTSFSITSYYRQLNLNFNSLIQVISQISNM